MTRQKILVVDDEPMIRWSLSEALREWGYTPIEAANGAQALDALALHHPVAVLLDINLPDSYGLDLLREIKHRQPQTIVIMVSAEAYYETAVSALRGGASDFIGKPINLEEVRMALHQSLEHSNEVRQLVPRHQSRVLIISDSQKHLRDLQNILSGFQVQVTSTIFPHHWEQSITGHYEFAIVDVGPERLTSLLRAMRSKPECKDIPILVEITRVAEAASLAGVLPKYRAMPVSRTELVALVRRRLAAMTNRYEVARIL